MDAVTAMTLDRGRKNNQLLIQPQYSPMPVGEQVAILYCGTHGLMHDVPVERCVNAKMPFWIRCVLHMKMLLMLYLKEKLMIK